MIRNVILDWSGTLVDDLPIVMEATNAALARVGRAPMSCEEFRAEFRLPVRAFYDRLFPGLPWEALQEAFHGRFEKVHERVEPLAHAREFLEFLRSAGCRVFLLTSVPDRYLHALMGRVGWGEYFEGLWTEALDKREVIRERVEGLGLLAEETLMVGDKEHDGEAARAMGCWAAVVLTGYQFESALLTAEPDVVVGDLAELRGGLEASGMEPFWRKNGRREEA